ncbi:3-deoxy-7-phosphoheptulonate synthase [Nocardia sp. NPDC058499]|uniref:3-deoxy-7-phosphoheptulonate synthase n=1 Tax=Nocardia sp. NPDC058499 TaxID=3346530 RepID=UPI003653A4AD
MTTYSEPREIKAAHQPDWPDPKLLDDVVDELQRRQPLVEAQACHALAGELEFVARGESFVIQAGECAELFADSTRPRIQAKAAQLHQLCDVVEAIGLPTVGIGRFAGQYAKPRSKPTEMRTDGSVVPVYLGDAVNGLAPTEAARRADPTRLLRAYDHAAEGLHSLFMRQLLLADGDKTCSMLAPTYISHEALILPFESALVRADHVKGGRYASSAHMLWIGERTRQLDHAHLRFAESINNPVGVKLGPSTEPPDLVEIVETLTRGRPAGRLCLVVRQGVDKIAERLPRLVTALGGRARDVVWLSDPMHGNTRTTTSGQKTRVLADMMDEVEQFSNILRKHGCWPGGLHLEITPDAVTECVATHRELASGPDLSRYESACDPRLNPGQAEQLVRHVADLLV